MVTMTSKGIQASTMPDLQRRETAITNSLPIRLPRFFPENGRLLPYEPWVNKIIKN